MNIYVKLNEIIEYIENNLEENIEYLKLAQIIGTNEYTMKRIFSLISNISLSEYIRNRRLSNAGFDLLNNNVKVIDIALKYQYESATAFSRAFEKFHGIKPSNVKNNPDKLKVFAKIKFNETINESSKMEYSIVEKEEIILYGKGIKTKYNTIQFEAPNFFSEFENKYMKKYGNPDYGLVFYEDRYESYNYEYWVAYSKEIKELKKIEIPKSKWLLFRINSQKAEDIQKVSREFYEKFLPSSKFNLKPIKGSKFNLRPLPELEYYHDGITDFFVPIES